MTELVFKDGRIHVEMVAYDGRIGVLLHSTSEPHEIGEFVSSNLAIEPRVGDLILWFDNLASLRIVQDELSRAALKIQNVLNTRGDARVA